MTANRPSALIMAAFVAVAAILFAAAAAPLVQTAALMLA